MTWIVLSALALAGSPLPSPADADEAPGLRVVVRANADTWADTGIASRYRSGAIGGGVGLNIPLPLHFGIDADFSYKRVREPAVATGDEAATAPPDRAFLEVMPVSLLFEYRFWRFRPVELFLGAGPSVLIYTEHQVNLVALADDNPGYTPQDDRRTVVRGGRPAAEIRLGTRIDTGLVRPPLPPASSAIDRLEVEVYGAKRFAPAKGGFDWNGWRAGVGLALGF